jgi:hypothetical protein
MLQIIFLVFLDRFDVKNKFLKIKIKILFRYIFKRKTL